MNSNELARPCLVFFAFLVAYATDRATAQDALTSMQLPVASRIADRIDDSVRVTVPHSRHSMATMGNDVGGLPGNMALQRLMLVLRGSSDQEYHARTLVDSQQSEGSLNYHQWLTPKQFGQQFGPSHPEIAQVTGWLQQHGFTIGSVAKSGLWIEFSGTSAQVEAAFHTQMRQYLVGGELHVANATDITIPQALAPVVNSVLSLHDFHSKPMRQPSQAIGPLTVDRITPNANSGNGNHFVTPGDLAAVYDLNPLYKGTTPAGTINGSGETIGIVAVSNITASDILAFQTAFGLTPKAPTIILNGPDPGVVGGSDEASLDVEYSGAIAPGATIDLVVSGGSITTDPVALSAAYIVDQNLADVMSVSFGACEQALGPENSFWNAIWEQAAAQGISVFVSSGDTGAAGCDPNAPPGPNPAQGGLGVNGVGSTPFNTSVGGTEFNETVGGATAATFWNVTSSNFASAIGYIPERVWNDSCSPSTSGSFCQQKNVFSLASGGGGISTLYSVPSYQMLNIQGLSGAGFSRRPVPDVSLDAANEHDPYVFCFTPAGQTADCQASGGSVTFNNFAGGTSFSAPEFAGIMALVDQAMGSRQGLANYVLYSLAKNESQSPGFGSCDSSNQTNPVTPPGSQCVFNDVVAGNIGVPGNDTLSNGAFVPPGDSAGQTGYDAVAGYDPAIGLGSVNAATLVNAWKGVTFQGSQTTITKPATSINITHGMAVSISVSVARQGATGTPSGTVSLVASGGNLPSKVGIGAALLSGGSGTATAGPVNVINLPGGTNYNLQASYPGDGTFAGSLSNTITATVAPENTTTTLQSFLVNLNIGQATSGITSVAYADPVNVLVVDSHTAGLSGLIPTSGNVTFTVSGSSPLSPVLIDNSGIAEIANCFAPLTNCLTPGSYTISAAYSGDGPASYNGSSSAPLTFTVTKGNQAPVVTAPATALAGTAFTLKASIPFIQGAVAPTGTVQFMNGTTALGGPLTLSNGQVSTQVPLSGGGVQSITAQYSGDNNYNAETSAAAMTIVDFDLVGTTTSQTIAAGGTATYQLNLNGVPGFAGQVSFSCTGAPPGATCAISPTSATLSATTTAVPLTVTVSNTANARLVPRPFRSLPFVFAACLALGGLGLRKKAKERMLMMLLAMFLVAGMSSCGGGGSTPAPRAPTNATLILTGTSGSVTSTTSLQLTVTH
jgi:hypothetical protein